MTFLQQLATNIFAGKMQNHPMMQQYNQMMQGKSFSEQMQTLLNSAKSKGIDINEKRFSDQDIKALGLSPVQRATSPREGRPL